MGLDRARRLFAARGAGAGAGASAMPPASPAAALLALFEECGDARVILIRRAVGLPRHPGEIALPGGSVEADESMVDAALREAEEEVGLSRADVEVVGWLDRVTGRTGSVVTPVVGLLARRPVLVAEPGEVAAVFDVALSDLMAVYRQEWWDEEGSDGRAMHFFELPEDTVWGLTARILHQLLADVTAGAGL